MDAGGLVQITHFSVLPDIGAGAAATIVSVSMLPLLVSVWRRPDPARFASCAALASLNRCEHWSSIVSYGIAYWTLHTFSALLSWPLPHLSCSLSEYR